MCTHLGPILCGRANGITPTIMRSLPRLSELVPWSHRAVSAIGCRALEFPGESLSPRIARWADLSDIKAAGLLGNDGVYVGAWRDKRGKISLSAAPRPEHVLCYAPTRSGKGVGLIVPTLLSWKQSVFVTDLKGELYELTAGWRHKPGAPTIAFCASNPRRRPVLAALTRWRNCALGPSTK